MWVFSMRYGSISTCNKMRVVPMHMFEMVVTMPGFDVISYGPSVLNPKALPAPPGYVAGLSLDQGIRTGTFALSRDGITVPCAGSVHTRRRHGMSYRVLWQAYGVGIHHAVTQKRLWGVVFASYRDGIRRRMPAAICGVAARGRTVSTPLTTAPSYDDAKAPVNTQLNQSVHRPEFFAVCQCMVAWNLPSVDNFVVFLLIRQGGWRRSVLLNPYTA